MKRVLSVVGSVALLLVVAARPASAALVTFEGLPDLTPVVDQFEGVTFTNAFAFLDFTAEWTTDDFGATIDPFSDPLSPMVLAFANPVSSFVATISYTGPVAYRGFLLDGTTVTSGQFGQLSGLPLGLDTPFTLENLFFDFLAFSAVPVFDPEVDPEGAGAEIGFFTLDNVEFESAPRAVPEPGTLSLLTLGAAGVLLRRRRSQ